ncbi:MAG: phosphotransferase family protein [Actinobacteria bacterium]|nr:MAG: phosphotransferase family protein [Actinomycetota bacterium]
MNVTAAHPELLAELQAEVREHLGPGARVEGLEALLGGSSRELWGFDVLLGAERLELVLRRDPPGVEDPAGRAREFAALRAAGAHGVPAPRVHWITADGTGLVMTRLSGESIPRRLLSHERYATARERLGDDIARAAAATHAVPLSELPELHAPEHPPALAAVEALEDQLDRLAQPHPALELGLRWLRARLPPPRPPALVHGDLRMGNLMVDEGGLVGLLDWELCHAGDPAEDLGWLCIRSWRFGDDALPAAGVTTRERLLDAYAAADGVRIGLDELRFWEVCGNARWGVICVAQADVHLSGRRASLEHAAIGRRACEAEWDLLDMLGP